ncbi:MAG: carboxypeptidase-like regulatory domain-containing protein, partial [Planctomycetota bacterium]
KKVRARGGHVREFVAALSVRPLDARGDDGVDEGVPDVPVVLTSANSSPRVEWTDGEGRYEFSDVSPSSSYFLAVGDASNSVEEWNARATEPDAGPIEIPSGKRVVLDLRSKHSLLASLDGLLRLDGTPTAAELRIVGKAQPIDRRVEVRADGRFRVRGLEPGEYRIVGLTAPFSRDVILEEGRRGSITIDLQTLNYGVSVVSSRTSLPILDGVVELRRVDGADAAGGLGARPNAGPASRGTSRRLSAAGRVEFGRLLPGRYRVRVQAPGYVPLEKFLSLDVSRDETLALQKGRDVRLRLKTPDGNPLDAAATVVVFRNDLPYIEEERHLDDGVLLLPALGPGNYEVHVRTSEYNYRRRLQISTPEAPKSNTPKPIRNVRRDVTSPPAKPTPAPPRPAPHPAPSGPQEARLTPSAESETNAP